MTKKVLTFLTIFIFVFYLVGSTSARAEDEITPLADDEPIVLEDNNYNYFLTVGHYVSKNSSGFFRLYNPITIYPEDLMYNVGSMNIRLTDGSNILIPKNVNIKEFISSYDWYFIYGREAVLYSSTPTNILTQYDSVLYGLLFLVGVIALCRLKN